jgi:hypothetical protein
MEFAMTAVCKLRMVIFPWKNGDFPMKNGDLYGKHRKSYKEAMAID